MRAEMSSHSPQAALTMLALRHFSTGISVSCDSHVSAASTAEAELAGEARASTAAAEPEATGTFNKPESST